MLAIRRRYYSSDRAVVAQFRYRHEVAESPIEVAVAPTPLVISTAMDGVAHPVVAALDLSATSRGREILSDWSLPPEFGATPWQ